MFTVRRIDAAEHRAFITDRDSVSFLQTPAWGEVKTEWRSESLGWFDADGALRGAGLVLYRQVPRLKRYLAYLPEGPSIAWDGGPDSVAARVEPLIAYLRDQRAFAVRIGPPVVTRRWDAATLKAAIADPALNRLDDVPADWRDADAIALTDHLAAAGWRPISSAGGFSAGQPRYNFWLPLTSDDAKPKSDDDLLAAMNQLWRRNIRKADKAGVTVRQGDGEDIEAFHRIYLETASRDHFTPRPLAYFERMWEALRSEDPERMRLYLAHHDNDLVAATTLVHVGTHAWYSYGASTTHKREVRGSNAIQWQMMRDARDAGANLYDMRGITDTLAEGDPHLGLIQFKVGTGGQAVEYLGEWDYPIRRGLYAAFTRAMRMRR